MEVTEPSTPAPPKPALPPPGSNLLRYATYLVDHAGFLAARLQLFTSTGVYKAFSGTPAQREIIGQFVSLGREARKLEEKTSVLSCPTTSCGRIIYTHRYDHVSGISIEISGLVARSYHQKHLPRTIRRLTDRLLRDRNSLDLTTASLE